ncbi:SCO family protein [Deinococcus sp.]|uniref:SCO family protein n=1 Tax=Deinococcus sp. TaxID=47478 RepID=UPI003B5CE660
MTELDQTQTPTQPESAARPWYISLIFALLAVALLLGGVWLYARVRNPFPFFGTTYTPPQTAPIFSATDQNGQLYKFSPFGKTTALFFGFTHCPNICPLSLTYLNKLKERLPEAQRQDFQVVFVSVDPERDSPAQLKSYVEFFGHATGLHIAEPALNNVARAYGAAYSKADIKGPQEYQVNHTTATYLIDKEGQLRLVWDYTQLSQLDKLQADLAEVMQ